MPRDERSLPEGRGFRCHLAIAFCLLISLALAGCGARTAAVRPVHPGAPPKKLARMGYAIQVGAFAQVENAARLTESLRRRDLGATYFVAAAGLYKVRFGNFTTRDGARSGAQMLKAAGVIDEFYIVSPEEYAVAKEPRYGTAYLREEIVRTARSFIGVPYLWGGNSPETGFDCSGLMVACYQLNGLELPRTSQEQFRTGIPISRGSLAKGDLVFFATSGGEKASHVGIYVGEGCFIHASGKGKNIRVESLSGQYFNRRYAGARSYL